MFKKILVANRGEIACRIFRTARRMGIATLAVYSDADRNALHVAMADEAIAIGPSPPADSYLNGDRIINVALAAGAEAIHPGYGFLSENADFAAACSARGLNFVGPSEEAIRAMGSKSSAKTIMEAAGVPLLPGYHGENQTAEFLHAKAREIGYPVLLKAAAGGGGKGMRIVSDDSQFFDSLSAAQRESINAFADDQMLVEKYLRDPRHVEVQIFCDRDGRGIYLGDRDCSVQRRHQKIIEEAPAPGLSEKLRKHIGTAAVRAAQAIDYEGAGTIEFLLDREQQFFFMEMNTRLQVEHPVTEMTVGQDLVEWQFRIAAGESLPLVQEQVSHEGHAIEARIYAEDPDNDFLPETGQLFELQAPEESQHTRVDTGVQVNSPITVHYDPMIAKLVTWGNDRRQAIERLRSALVDYRIDGVRTNQAFLYKLLINDEFRAANLSTEFVDAQDRFLFGHDKVLDTFWFAVAVIYVLLKHEDDEFQLCDPMSPWNKTDAWRPNLEQRQTVRLRYNDDVLEGTVTKSREPSDTALLTVGGEALHISGSLLGQTLNAQIDDRHVSAEIVGYPDRFTVYAETTARTFYDLRSDAVESAATQAGPNLVAPMNGTVTRLLVKPGVAVKKSQALVIIEAMKMEHTLRASADGMVESFLCEPGQLVDGGALLAEFIPSQAPGESVRT